MKSRRGKSWGWSSQQGPEQERPVSLGKGLDFIMYTSGRAWQGSKEEVIQINLFHKESSSEDALEAGGSLWVNGERDGSGSVRNGEKRLPVRNA